MPFEIPVSWTDRLGLAGESGFRLRVDALKDAAPTCYLQGIDRQKVMLPEETLDFEVLAEDDFGVKATGIEWTGQFTRPTDESPAKGELKLGDGAPEERRMLKPAAFSPAAFGITPQKITLRAYAEDHFPDRGRVYSEPVILYVLTRDEHAQMLKSRFDRQITELEDLARREQELLEENERLESLDGADLQKEENQKRLETQEQEEAETKRRMEDLTEQMEQLMKDAARNGDIDKKTLQKMAESLKSMQELAEKDVPKVQEKLGDSQEQSNTPEKSEKDVDQAVEQQKKVVEKMQEAIEKANEANRRFEAGTFVNRLKKAAAEENGIVSSLKEAFERMLGLTIPGARSLGRPPPRRKLAPAGGHRLGRALDAGRPRPLLSPAPRRIRSRRSSMKCGSPASTSAWRKSAPRWPPTIPIEAAEQAKKWADKLTEWAKKLEGEKEDQDGGGGGDGGAPDSEDEDFEFMLRVMKMIQQEQDLRARTRVLEQLRRDLRAQPQPHPPSHETPAFSSPGSAFCSPPRFRRRKATPEEILAKHQEGSEQDRR